MFGLSKIYTMGIVAVIAAAAVAGIFFYGKSLGYSECVAAQAKAQVKQLEDDAKAIDKLKGKQDARNKTVIKYKTIIKKIPVKDCLRRFPDDRVNRMRDAFSDIAGRKADR